MRRLPVLLAFLVLSGCGGGSTTHGGGGVQGGNSGAGPAAKNADAAQLRTLADTYLHAVAAKDWTKVCATRAAAEQKQFARLGGSCPRMFGRMMAGKPVAIFGTAKAAAVRIRGDIAGIDVVQPGSAKVQTTLAAVKDGGEWKLKDVPDAKTP